MGAVLKNTSQRIAYRTRVAFRIKMLVADKPQTTTLETTEIPIILPGQRVGVGRGINIPGQATGLTIDRKTTTWLAPNALGSYQAIRTSYRSSRRANTAPSSDSVRYTERSPNCRKLVSRGTAVIFRDAHGAIVGGDLTQPDGKGNPASGGQPTPSSPSCSPGQRTTWIVPFDGIPARADDKRTQLYSYCDLNAPKPDVDKTP